MRGRWMAAVLACGPDAALSHRSAAMLWGMLELGGGRIDVSVRRRGTHGPRGVAVHCAPMLETTVRDGIPVTTPARTLLDLAATAPARVLARAVEGAERQRVFDLRAIEALMTPRRPGVARLRAAIAGYDGAPTRHELERRFLELCDAHALPRPLVNAAIEGFEVDFLWPAHKVVVETDGLAFHGTRAAAERDRERDAVLTLAGYRTQRFTWRQVTAAPATVAATLRALLDDADRGTRREG